MTQIQCQVTKPEEGYVLFETLDSGFVLVRVQTAFPG